MIESSMSPFEVLSLFEVLSPFESLGPHTVISARLWAKGLKDFKGTHTSTYVKGLNEVRGLYKCDTPAPILDGPTRGGPGRGKRESPVEVTR